ncbi:serine/threonine protein kinase [Myxococcus landrumensis]|uniref:Serine/threonine protein kinase n=1 Tax=Myxococcus landrumensis TaxID=2813577 RepID=A0ABX7MZ27_9BACT|nr:serine/threonine-protein kinase [Myxococcus landrumus]QSQ10747.1 serine/threonine protein kinase [Myxococcus landrumus]
MTVSLPAEPSGISIDGWTVLKELGNGGFAVVYLVEKHTRRCALKVARHRDSSGDDKQTHARTMRELTALLLLDHPNIVRHQGYGYAERGNAYLALDHVEGWTMAEWVERKHPTFREVLTVFDKLSSALSYMHSRGVLHRDLKLSNVLIRKSDGEPVIIDFSCATFAAAEELTDSGLPPGTDRFRAPEQFRWLQAHTDQHRARYAYQVADEIFALGVMLFDILTDPRPTALDARVSLNSPTFKPPVVCALNHRVPEVLSDLVDCMLSRDPERRPVDTEALRREMGELLVDPSEEYQRPVHPPSEQLPIESTPVPVPDGSGAVALPSRRKAGGLAALATLGVLVVAGALWLNRDVPASAPSTQPEGSRSATAAPIPASPPLPPAMSLSSLATVAQPGPDAVAQVQKEGPTVKNAPTSEVQPQGRQSRGRTKPTVAAECTTMTLVAALAAGCPGAQIRPESFTCPAGAEEVMREDLRWVVNESFAVTLDGRYKRNELVWFTAGAEVEGVVPKGVDARARQVAPTGTRFYGKAYYLSDKMGRSEGPALVIRYDRVKLPGQDERPVCFVVEMTAYGYKDGRVQASNAGGGYVVDRWP